MSKAASINYIDPITSVDQLETITAKIKQLTTELTKLKKEKEKIEEKLIEYIDERDVPGVKYRDTMVTKDEKNYRTKKPKAVKLENLATVLDKYGISDHEAFIDSFTEAGKGDEKTKTILKLKKITKK
jgi:hypothetical protein